MSSTDMGVDVKIGGSIDKSLGAALRDTTKSTTQLQAKVKDLWGNKNVRKEIKTRTRLLKDLKAKQDELGHSSVRLGRGIEDTSRRLAKARREAREYNIELGKLARQQRDVQKNKLLGATAVAGGAGYAASKPLGKAMSREESISYLKTVLNTDNISQALKQAVAYANKVERDKFHTFEQIIDVQYALNSAGLTANASRLGSLVVANVAKVTKGEAGGVGEVMATTYNNLGKSLQGNTLQKLERIGDVLTKTQFKFQIRDFAQLGESMKLAAPAIAGYNIELEQGLALVGQLNTAGMQGSMAGTALSAMLRQLNKAQNEFDFDIVRDGNGQLDVIKTLEGLKTAFDEFDDRDELMLKIQKAFGDEGMRGAIALTEALDSLKSNYRSVKTESKGLVDTIIGDFDDNSIASFKRLGNNLNQLGVVVANTVLPVISPLVSGISSIIGGVISLTESSVILRYMVGLSIGAFAGFLILKPVILLFGILRLTMISNITAFALFKAASATFLATTVPRIVAGIRMISLAFMSSPLGLLLGGASLLGGALWAGGAFSSSSGGSTPISPAAAGKPSGVRRSSENNVTHAQTIHVHQQPGQSGESLASQVTDQIYKRERRDFRYGYYDDTDD